MRPEDEMVGAQMTEYTPDSIREVAEVLAPQAGNYTNALTSQIGQAQQSMGPLAAATMGTPVQGIGNYTYNRLVRPQVDTMRDELLVQGYTNSLNKMLSDKLKAARDAYNKRSSGGTTKSNDNGNGDFDIEEENTGSSAGKTNVVAKEEAVDGSKPGRYQYTYINKITGQKETGVFRRNKSGNIDYISHFATQDGRRLYTGNDASNWWNNIQGRSRSGITFRKVN